MEIRYITTRDLQNSSGEIKGKVRVIVLKGESTANIDLTCPECGHTQNKKQEFKLPLNLQCEKCGFKMKLESLRKEIKKK
jgi:ribosomal protein L37AE/L43A